jgi:hypothetical protein
LIHHLSFPRGSSVNDAIATENTSVHYATVADAIRLIKLAGPGCFLAKTDVKNAFRIIPIRPSDHYLLGMKWRGLYYFDRCATACLWVLPALAKPLKFLVLRFNGLLNTNSISTFT